MNPELAQEILTENKLDSEGFVVCPRCESDEAQADAEINTHVWWCCQCKHVWIVKPNKINRALFENAQRVFVTLSEHWEDKLIGLVKEESMEICRRIAEVSPEHKHLLENIFSVTLVELAKTVWAAGLVMGKLDDQTSK